MKQTSKTVAKAERATYTALADQVRAALGQQRKDNLVLDADCPDLAVAVVLGALAAWHAESTHSPIAEGREWVAECARTAASG